MDLYYVDHFSLLFDMKIIFMTIIQIIKKGGN
ncbi:sugar transferase, partial [Xenorhabdus bovienii]|nr:sugar transferase [Xenorhabdus bovienii]